MSTHKIWKSVALVLAFCAASVTHLAAESTYGGGAEYYGDPEPGPNGEVEVQDEWG